MGEDKPPLQGTIQHSPRRDLVAAGCLVTADLSEEELEEMHKDYQRRAEDTLDRLKQHRPGSSTRAETARSPALGMHVLGEPIGRHLVAEAALLGLAVDEGARRGELEAEPDIIDEARDVGVGCAAADAAEH